MSATLKRVGSFYFYTLVLGFLAGVAGASAFTISFPYVALLALIAGAIYLVAQRKPDTPAACTLILISVCGVAILLGLVRFQFASYDEVVPVFESQLDTEVTLEGIVVREPDVREQTTHLYVRVDQELLLVKTHRYVQVSYGDQVLVAGVLEKPTTFKTDLGRTFNYPKYLQARGVSYALSFADVTVTSTGNGIALVAYTLAAKKLFMERIEAVLPEPQVGLAEGLLLGVKQALGDEIETVFRKTGIIHIVVLSGYNVMLVVVFITYVLSYILPYRARFPFGIAAIICFAILVGLSATVVRASIMAGLILFARATGRTYAVMRALVFAGVIMIMINPYLLLYDVGFQLSFVATLGLIFISSHIEKLVHFMPTMFGLREFLTATVSTQIFVMPILLYNIGELSVISVVVNVLVLPMVPVAMLLTFITGLIGFVSAPLATLVGFATYVSLSYILVIATFFAKAPFAVFSVPAFPFWVVPICYAAMGYGIYRVRNGSKRVSGTNLTGWTVVEEDTLRKKTATAPSGAVAEVPIFFR